MYALLIFRLMFRVFANRTKRIYPILKIFFTFVALLKSNQ